MNFLAGCDERLARTDYGWRSDSVTLPKRMWGAWICGTLFGRTDWTLLNSTWPSGGSDHQNGGATLRGPYGPQVYSILIKLRCLPVPHELLHQTESVH